MTDTWFAQIAQLFYDGLTLKNFIIGATGAIILFFMGFSRLKKAGFGLDEIEFLDTVRATFGILPEDDAPQWVREYSEAAPELSSDAQFHSAGSLFIQVQRRGSAVHLRWYNKKKVSCLVSGFRSIGQPPAYLGEIIDRKTDHPLVISQAKTGSYIDHVPSNSVAYYVWHIRPSRGSTQKDSHIMFQVSIPDDDTLRYERTSRPSAVEVARRRFDEIKSAHTAEATLRVEARKLAEELKRDFDLPEQEIDDIVKSARDEALELIARERSAH